MITEQTITRCKNLIQESEAILIGAGAGLSAAGGLLYSGKRFTDNFADFIEKYELTDMYSSAFYPYPSPEEKWAFWSRYIKVNRYDPGVLHIYDDLLNIVKNKPHFVVTTNADGQFFKAGFEPEQIFYTQGDYREFQCSQPCHDTLYDNEEMVLAMTEQQSDCRIPTALVPRCPRCGEEMKPHLRADRTFIENEDWHNAQNRYLDFISKFVQKKLLLFELGIGYNTPGIIRFPFEKMAKEAPQTHLIRMNLDNIETVNAIPAEKITLIKADIAEVMARMM